MEERKWIWRMERREDGEVEGRGMGEGERRGIKKDRDLREEGKRMERRVCVYVFVCSEGGWVWKIRMWREEERRREKDGGRGREV